MAMKTPKRTNPKMFVILSKDRTTRPANAIAKNVEKEFRAILKKTNVMVLDHFLKEMTLERYFLNRSLFVRLMGDNIHALDYAMRAAVAMTIRDTVMDNLTKETSVYPGYWDIEAIVIPMAHVAVLEGSDTPGEWYLSIKLGATSVNSAEILMQMEAGDVPDAMNFTYYNPNRLTQMIYKVSISITRAIVSECQRYPTAELYTGSDDVTPSIRYAMGFRDYITDDNDFEFAITGVPPYEKHILEYLNAMEKKMVVYFCYLLSTAGVSDKMVNTFVDQLKLHAIFDADKAKTLADVAVNYLMVIPSLAENNQIMFSFTIKEVADILSKETESKPKLFTFGTRLKRVLHEMIDLCITIAIEEEKQKANTEESVDTEPGLPDIE